MNPIKHTILPSNATTKPLLAFLADKAFMINKIPINKTMIDPISITLPAVVKSPIPTVPKHPVYCPNPFIILVQSPIWKTRNHPRNSEINDNKPPKKTIIPDDDSFPIQCDLNVCDNNVCSRSVEYFLS